LTYVADFNELRGEITPDRCKEFNLLTVTVREWKTGKGGGWVERVLLRGLLVSANDLRKIRPAAHG